MKKKCLWCEKRLVSLFGKYDQDSNICGICLDERSIDTKPVAGEWSRHAKADMETHSKDILQPLKKDGTVNRHFVEAHGTKSLEKNLKVSRKEILDNVERYG